LESSFLLEVVEADRAVEKTLSILDKIVGSEKPNYIYARALLGLADIQT
jgi:hypothetical protein